MKTIGQVAYEKYLEAFVYPNHRLQNNECFEWRLATQATKDGWEAIAEAAVQEFLHQGSDLRAKD